MLSIEPTAIADVVVVTTRRFADNRGYFSETYNRQAWHAAGLRHDYVQDNHSYNAAAGTLRGLHFQAPPFAQDKLVRVLRGRILDVAVDLRAASPTRGQHVAVELSAENGRQLLVPVGFAHGFVTLEPDTDVLYKVTAPYSPTHDRGVAFDDPTLGIDWRFPHVALVMNDKDRSWPMFAALESYFP